ncbi:hypothetical protein NDU88_004406 [Pleurodeles waltl]|uniref:Uncharacterized protein n=1 Tax=Pleurodeles waltl TaxID=8319 RepID=A0AAV7TR70_PLEWA|nr:hypothetical protein NDU88_004406 [Pleurodeles waltl]
MQGRGVATARGLEHSVQHRALASAPGISEDSGLRPGPQPQARGTEERHENTPVDAGLGAQVATATTYLNPNSLREQSRPREDLEGQSAEAIVSRR